jgi:hypothetical protein
MPKKPAKCQVVVRGSYASGAIFSSCERYRYQLWRRWYSGPGAPRLAAFIGLNPSTADETVNDPTVTRCIGFAKRYGCDGIYMLNAFAFRATDPRDMKSEHDPVGPLNDAYILETVGVSARVVVAWGTHGSYQGRDLQLAGGILLGEELYCLGKTKAGHPRHPLYLSNDTKLERWR